MDQLVAAVIEARRAGFVERTVYCDLANEPGKNLRDAIRRVDGGEPEVRAREGGRGAEEVDGRLGERGGRGAP